LNSNSSLLKGLSCVSVSIGSDSATPINHRAGKKEWDYVLKYCSNLIRDQIKWKCFKKTACSA